jgi:hypothetical protein
VCGEKRTVEFVEGDASIRILDEAQSIEPREVRRQLGGRKEEATVQTTDLRKRMRAKVSTCVTRRYCVCVCVCEKNKPRESGAKS